MCIAISLPKALSALQDSSPQWDFYSLCTSARPSGKKRYPGRRCCYIVLNDVFSALFGVSLHRFMCVCVRAGVCVWSRDDLKLAPGGLAPS